MNLTSILLWGFVATVMLTTCMSVGQGLGLSRMSIPFILGTMVTPDRNRAPAIGFLLHVTMGWLFAFLYAQTFESWQWVTWWLGGGIGLVHGLKVLIALMSDGMKFVIECASPLARRCPQCDFANPPHAEAALTQVEGR